MDGLILRINKLQDILDLLGEKELDLPQIVVIGSQSTGKSSVLENLVGHDFLPRGTGIVTRRPLVIQIINIPANSNTSNPKPWGQFKHQPGMRFSLAEVKEEITNATNRIAGTNKDVSEDEIELSIHVPDTVNLRLCDLPGIAKVPVGNQPSDIEQQIHNMIMKYIKKANSLILAVTAANTDLANSDALKLAHSVDPEGNRTLGVITKVDIMDKGTNAYHILTGKIFKLKHGFYATVSRSQRDNIEKKTIQESLQLEESFFKSHPLYINIEDRCGTSKLANALSNLLGNHIRDRLPAIQQLIQEKLSECNKDLSKMGPLPKYSNDLQQFASNYCNMFVSNYGDMISGSNISSKKILGGSRINKIYHVDFTKKIYQSLEHIEAITPTQIYYIMRNSSGIYPFVFTPNSALNLIIVSFIQKLAPICIGCIDQVIHELSIILNQCKKTGKEIEPLSQKIYDSASAILQDCVDPCKNMVKEYIGVECAYLNINHPEFSDYHHSIISTAQGSRLADELNPKECLKSERRKGNSVSNAEDQTKSYDNCGPDFKSVKTKYFKSPDIDSSVMDPHIMNHCIILKSLALKYIKICLKAVADTVPKIITKYLIYESLQKMKEVLSFSIIKSDVTTIIGDAIAIAQEERQTITNKIKCFNRAYKDIDSIKAGSV